MLRKEKRIKLGKQVYRGLMMRVLERDGWRCRKCGSLENLQVHHWALSPGERKARRSWDPCPNRAASLQHYFTSWVCIEEPVKWGDTIHPAVGDGSS